MGLFGKSKKKQAKLNPEATLKSMETLRSTIDDISKRTTLLQTRCATELQQALQRKKQGDKAGALSCMKRKKMYETEIAKLEQSQLNIEQQLFAIESASMNKNIFESLQQGNATLTQVHGKVSIETVEKLKDDMEEQDELLQEINETISQPVGLLATLDEGELLEELDELEAKEYETGLLETDAPAQQLPQQRQQPAEDELENMFDQMQTS